MGEKGLQTFDQGLLCTELHTHIDRCEVTRREKRALFFLIPRGNRLGNVGKLSGMDFMIRGLELQLQPDTC
jgi:hypothetical protein